MEQNNLAYAVGGFPCPRCKNQIRFPIQALLTQPSFTCGCCGLELVIDQECSEDALQSLRKYMEGMADAERMMKEARQGA